MQHIMDTDAEISELRDSINSKLSAIIEHQEKQKGFIAGMVFAASSIVGAGWAIFTHWGK
jgi:hypothetical protein